MPVASSTFFAEEPRAAEPCWGPAHPDVANWERSPRGGVGLGKSCGLQVSMELGWGKGHRQDMEGQKAHSNGPKCL